MKNSCGYYIEGNEDAAELVESYAECVPECPNEHPVHAEGSNVCTTCTDLAGTQYKFWSGGDLHTENSCVQSCRAFFYKVVGKSYQCASECDEH